MYSYIIYNLFGLNKNALFLMLIMGKTKGMI